MFVFSVKGKKLKIAIAVITVLIIVLLVFNFTKKKDIYTVTYGEYSFNIKVENEADVRRFLEQFGWQTEDTPVEISTIRIPSVFNDIYTEYNTLQMSQGFDLSEYMGETCTKYTYSVLNYPDEDCDINATVIVCGDRVIAADIADSSYNGFIRGLWNEE